ncbi:hypothetical protein TNCV_4366531 [Trichonephila clavipes]|nr:hypothetical protein TNCV_4366531 [Trichonephila clavipes]
MFLFVSNRQIVSSVSRNLYFDFMIFIVENNDSSMGNRGGGDFGGVAIYRPFGEFRRAKSYCLLYGIQGQRQAYL